MDMRTEQGRPVRLEDYRPPDWLVESVELDVSLDPTATRVRAALTLRPNGNGAAPAPLMLDGEALTLRALTLDGAALGPRRAAPGAPPAAPAPAPPLGASGERSLPRRRQRAARRLISLQSQL